MQHCYNASILIVCIYHMQHALEHELQRKSAGGDPGGDALSFAGQKAYIETLAQTLSSPSKPHNPLKADDLVRRSEVSM